ncbi:MAG: zinc-dependent alcohol dehydrogenase family protein [Gammaproteobacteria bacterium]|nr:zinc-dependent alcohol dehydrogenase family protein [Gammaproteobacteria bacterium]
MKAMMLEAARQPLVLSDVNTPEVGPEGVLIRVRACAVCRTDLHVCDGDLPEPKLPLIPGHEIVGEVVEAGIKAEQFKPGDRVGVPWLGYTCGKCRYCTSGNENLCDDARFTGYQIDGGYAEYTVADPRFVFPLVNEMSDVETAPLLCAGLIGFRSLRMAGDARRLGVYGFGAAAHIVTQIAIYEGREVYAFTRQDDKIAQEFAKKLGAVWSGSSDERPPELIDAAIIYAPVGNLVPCALRSLRKGGIVVCAGIHMTEIPSFPYHILWGERSIKSVANLTRRDGEEFLALAPTIPIHTETETFTLASANEALTRLRRGDIRGAAVLVMD